MLRSKNSSKQPTLATKSMMESLQLPSDMFWDGKMEPMSPPLADHLSRSNFEEFLLYEEDDCLVDDLIRNHQNVLFITDDGEQSGEELLIELNLEVKNELWLDEKSNHPPPLEDLSPVSSPTPVVAPFPFNDGGNNNKNTEELLMEFEQIYDAVELTHLTPPQTPPHQDQSKFDADCYQIFNNFQQHQQPELKSFVPQQLVYQQPQQQQQFFANSSFQAFSAESAANEMTVDATNGLEVVDELVRTHCKELPDFSSSESCASSLSPPHSEISYSSSTTNEGRYSSSVYSHDEDWSPSKKSSTSSSVGVKRETTGRKRRLPGVDKKSRKKEQNKNAATRYRQKKKAEVEVILEVEKDLAVKNDKLQNKYNDIKREVKYLKNLMRELLTAKGVLV